jgi:hypothetical protein
VASLALTGHVDTGKGTMVRAHDGSMASPQMIHASLTSMACGSERLFVSIIIISIHQVMPWPKSLQRSYIDSSSENE